MPKYPSFLEGIPNGIMMWNSVHINNQKKKLKSWTSGMGFNPGGILYHYYLHLSKGEKIEKNKNNLNLNQKYVSEI